VVHQEQELALVDLAVAALVQALVVPGQLALVPAERVQALVLVRAQALELAAQVQEPDQALAAELLPVEQLAVLEQQLLQLNKQYYS
jgi:hypothetical protein